MKQYLHFIVILLSLFILTSSVMAQYITNTPKHFKNIPKHYKMSDNDLYSSALFFKNNGYICGEYIYSDNDNRRLSVYFLNTDTLVIRNTSKPIKNELTLLEGYYVHFKNKNVIVVDSLVYSLRKDTTYLDILFHNSNKHLNCRKEVQHPRCDIKKITCPETIFYLLQPGDEIYVSNSRDRLKIKDFTFVLKDVIIEDYHQLLDVNKILPFTSIDTITTYLQIIP